MNQTDELEEYIKLPIITTDNEDPLTDNIKKYINRGYQYFEPYKLQLK